MSEVDGGRDKDKITSSTDNGDAAFACELSKSRGDAEGSLGEGVELEHTWEMEVEIEVDD